MYAVIKSGGKQYRVASGDLVKVEKIDGGVGERVELTEVLLVGGDGPARIGQPLLPDARVTAEILEQGRGEKIIVFKKKRRKGYRRKAGHRQALTTLKISEILL
jgi:large subunit ribosomal protein L21